MTLSKSLFLTETEKSNCITAEYDKKNSNISKTFIVTAQDAYNYVASKVFADQQLCMVLKLSGKIDETSFARALLLTKQAISSNISVAVKLRNPEGI